MFTGYYITQAVASSYIKNGYAIAGSFVVGAAVLYPVAVTSAAVGAVGFAYSGKILNTEFYQSNFSHFRSK